MCPQLSPSEECSPYREWLQWGGGSVKTEPTVENQFAKVDPVTGETVCTKIPLEYHMLDDGEYAFGNRNLTDDLKAKGRSSAFNENQIDGLCVIKVTVPVGTDKTQGYWDKSITKYSYKSPRACEIMGDCMYQNPECEPDGVSPSKGGCGHDQKDQWNSTGIRVNDDTGEMEYRGGNKSYGSKIQATIENFIQNSGVEIIEKRKGRSAAAIEAYNKYGRYETVE
jgi:hypothetical protein